MYNVPEGFASKVFVGASNNDKELGSPFGCRRRLTCSKRSEGITLGQISL